MTSEKTGVQPELVELIHDAVSEVHPLGEHTAGDHASAARLSGYHVASSVARGGSVEVAFAAEVLRESEFGTRVFWHLGTLTARQGRLTSANVTQHADSGLYREPRSPVLCVRC